LLWPAIFGTNLQVIKLGYPVIGAADDEGDVSALQLLWEDTFQPRHEPDARISGRDISYIYSNF